jgi:hypothetical protein
MLKLTLLLLLTCLASEPAASAELDVATPVRHTFALPRERHVLEVVGVSAYGVRFIINGHAFAVANGACSGWVAGDRVSLVAGEWHGYCATAVFHNATRRRDCETWCNTW